MTNITLTLPEALKRALGDFREGKLAEAEKLCRQIISKKNDFFDATHMLAVVLARLGRNEEALKYYDQALALRPGHAEVLNNRAVALHELKRFDEAIESFDQALTAWPEYVEAIYNRSNILKELNRFEEALAGYEQALARRPDYADALNNQGLALHHLKRFADAVASFEQALKVQPNHFDALNNRGNSLKALDRQPEALASYERALALRPDDVTALTNYGIALQEMKRFTEALANFERARMLRPDYAEAHLGEAEIKLLHGDFAAGWREYEWRWKVAQSRQSNPDREVDQTIWLGAEALDGKTILLQSEQRIGDTIQFCRYAPLIAKRGAHVILQVQEPLRELMTSLDGAPQVIAKDAPLPDFHFHCPLLSLPLAFETRLESIPANVPYLSASKTHLRKWKKRLPKPSGPRVGLTWAGSPDLKGDFSRSIGLQSLLPLLARTDLHFYSLQNDLRDEDENILRSNPLITHLGDEIETFDDTARSSRNSI